jgi:hypothetical protein
MTDDAPRSEPTQTGGSTALYEVLGVAPTAAPEDIRRAYHRKALTCHPDRAGPGKTAEFQRLQHAYEVLADPSKRRAYDRYGEEGLKMMDGNVTPLMRAFGTKALVSVSCFAGVLVLCLLLVQLILLSVKIDGEKGWTWPATLVPLWLLDFAALAVVATTVGIAVRNAVKDEQAPPIGVVDIASLLAVICYVATTILVAVALETGSFGALPAFAPVIFAELLLIITLGPQLSPKLIRERLHMMTGQEVSPWIVRTALADQAGFLLVRIATFVLLGVKIDGYFGSGVHYFLAAAPYVVSAALGLVAAWFTSSLTQKSGEMTFGQRVASIIASFLRHGVIIAGLVLVSIKAQTDGSEPAALAICFIPWFAVCGYGLCGLCAMGVLMANSASDDMTELERMQRQEEAMAHDTANTAS